jgi:hypothetical protein
VSSNRAAGERSNAACAATAKVDSTASRTKIRRGLAVSAADISVDAPITCASDGPNMTNADSSAEPVRSFTTIASVRLVIVDDALPSALLSHRLRNSVRPKISR